MSPAPAPAAARQYTTAAAAAATMTALDAALAQLAQLSVSGKAGHAVPLASLPQVAGAQPESNVQDIFKLLIATQVAELTGATVDAVFAALEAPKNADLADFAIATPRLRLKGNPVQLTQELVGKFVTNDFVTEAIASGPFMNFKVNASVRMALTLSMIAQQQATYGTNASGAGKKAVIEFSSPNIAKPFHAGHLRSTIIGNFTRNALKANGWATTAINYLGDWGKQYGLLAVGFARHGDEAKLQADPIRHLFDVYVQVNKDAEEDPTVHDEARAYFKKMEDGDASALALWQRFRDLSIVKYKEIYGRLNIEFDVYSGESQVPGATMDAALADLTSKGLLKLDDGAQIVDLKKDKLGVVVVQKTDGTTLYITRDIGAAVTRREQYAFDAMHYVVAAQQDLHFKQLFKILELMGYEWGKQCSHINFGMVQGMSTRKGTVVFLEDILDQTQEVMLEQMKKNEVKYAQIEEPEKVADLIGLSAIVVQDMSARRIKDYTFAWDRMFSFEGDTGPYLQYAHARLASIERKTGVAMPPADMAEIDLTILTEPSVQPLVALLAAYPDMVRALPGNGFEPSNVVTYLFRLCHAVSTALDQLYVVGQEEKVLKTRLFLYWSTRQVLGNGLRLIGLRPLERM